MIVTPPQCWGVSLLTMKSWEINSESNKLVQPTNARLFSITRLSRRSPMPMQNGKMQKKLEIGKMQKKLGNCKTRPVSKLSNLQIQNLHARDPMCKTFTGLDFALLWNSFFFFFERVICFIYHKESDGMCCIPIWWNNLWTVFFKMVRLSCCWWWSENGKVGLEAKLDLILFPPVTLGFNVF